VKKTLVISAGMALVLAAPAAAGPQIKHDGNDTKGPLDVRRSRITHTNETLTGKIATYNPWSSLSRKGNRVLFWFTGPYRRTPVLFAAVRRKNGRLVAPIFDVTGRKSRRMGQATARRIGPTSLHVTVPLRLLTGLQSELLWGVSTFYKGGACVETCEDFAPNRDYFYLHYLDNPPPGGPPDPPPPPDDRMEISREISARL
jgi:hypothetical protein